MKVTLRNYQKEAVSWFLKVRKGILGDQMGLGKTITSIACIKYLKAYPALVICPKSITDQWVSECEKCGLTAGVLTTQSLKKDPNPKYHVYVIGYSQIHRFHLRALKMLIVDEFHWIKNPSTIRGHVVKAYAKRTPNVLLLSGTPITNSPKDLIHPLDCIDKLKLIADNWKYFVTRYCDYNPDAPYASFGSSNGKELYNKLSKTCYLRREKDQLRTELPPKMRHVLSVTLKKRKKEYLALKDEARAQQHSFLGNTAKLLGLIHKLRQVCCAEKMPYILQWIKDFKESTGGQLIVFGYYKKYLHYLAERDKQGVCMTGETPMKKRTEIIKLFNEKKIRTLYLNMTVGGVGLNLMSASTILFYELPWTHAEFEQCEDRIHRIGQKANQCNYYNMLVKDTYDIYMWNILNRKKKIGDEAVNGKDAEDIKVNSILKGFFKD